MIAALDVIGIAQVGLAVVLGAMVGSFLNVCIYRLPRHESIVRPRSRCTRCGYSLAWYDNIPVVSYAWLRGRCRKCGEPVSWQYPLVETATALAVGLECYYWGWSASFAIHAAFACIMIVLFVTDIRERVLPNAVTIPGTVAGFIVTSLLGSGWVDALLGIALGGGSLFLIAEAYYRVRGEEGMGMDDVKMMALVGAWLGWQLTFLTLVLGSLLGSVIGVIVIAARGRDIRYQLPFGTFLAVAALVADSIGAAILAWYVGLYP